MIAAAVLIGALSGAGIIIAMQRSGMLAERSGAAILLAAIAFFYPVFAVIEGDILEIALHVAIFAGFSFLALRAFRLGLNLIAGGMIAHGLFDISLGMIGAPGPVWWPAYCATLDIVAGGLILRLIQTGKLKT